MRIVVIYVVGIALIALLFICTMPYKKTLRNKLDKRQHKLKLLYGIAMFVADRIPKKVIYRNNKTNNLIRELSVKEDIRKEKYLYVVEKISISFLVIFVSLVFGILVSVSESGNGSTVIKKLDRDSSQIKTYEFVAENEDGQQETVNIELNKKELSEESIRQLFDSIKEPLTEQVLKDNESADYVDSQLDFVSGFGEENILISWEISDSSIVGYDGNISENVSEKGEIVNLTAMMILEDVSEEYTFSVKVFPPKDKQSLQNQIQSYVNANGVYDDEVQLPSEINGERLKYFYATENMGIWILPVGIILAVGIFFLKDKDLKKESENRNEQMMRDYPQIISKTLLYYSAGLSILSTFERIVQDYKSQKIKDENLFRYAYEELELALTKMKSGVSESIAINEFGVRCGLHCYIKFAGILEQNLKRGSRDLTYALKTEVNSAMLVKKNSLLKEGNKISTKLLGPMILMLIISMAIIMVPAFLSVNL